MSYLLNRGEIHKTFLHRFLSGCLQMLHCDVCLIDDLSFFIIFTSRLIRLKYGGRKISPHLITFFICCKYYHLENLEDADRSKSEEQLLSIIYSTSLVEEKVLRSD